MEALPTSVQEGDASFPGRSAKQMIKSDPVKQPGPTDLAGSDEVCMLRLDQSQRNELIVPEPGRNRGRNVTPVPAVARKHAFDESPVPTAGETIDPELPVRHDRQPFVEARRWDSRAPDHDGCCAEWHPVPYDGFSPYPAPQAEAFGPQVDALAVGVLKCLHVVPAQHPSLVAL